MKITTTKLLTLLVICLLNISVSGSDKKTDEKDISSLPGTAVF